MIPFEEGEGKGGPFYATTTKNQTDAEHKIHARVSFKLKNNLASARKLMSFFSSLALLKS